MDRVKLHLRQAKYRRTHKKQIQEVWKKYRIKNRERLNQKRRESFKRLKEAALTNPIAKAKLLAMREKKNASNKQYKIVHPKKSREQAKKWRDNHKEERREYDKNRAEYHREHSRKHCLCTVLNGNRVHLHNLSKRPYPNPADCELCGKSGLRLVYHHYEETSEVVEHVASTDKPVFLLGFWVCQPCNLLIHRLTEFPFLAEKWFAMLECQRKSAGYG